MKRRAAAGSSEMTSGSGNVIPDDAGLGEFLARGQYPGGKNAAETVGWILGHFPPHSLYVEAFAGSAGIARRKIPALKTVLIDADVVPVRWLRRNVRRLVPGAVVIHGDAVEWLERHVERLPADALLYLDPPYLLKRRRGGRVVETVAEQPYNVRFTRDQHARLLAVADRAACFVVLSGYESELYGSTLQRPKWPWIKWDISKRLRWSRTHRLKRRCRTT